MSEEKKSESTLSSFFIKENKFDSELDDIFQKGSFSSSIVQVPVSNTTLVKSTSEPELETKETNVVVPTGKAKNTANKQRTYDPSKQDRTIFVGNLSLEAVDKSGTKILNAYFSKFGKIQSIRFRSMAFEKQSNRKAAFIKKEFHEKRSIVNAYIVFETKEEAAKSLKANGILLFKKHIRVDSAGNEEKDYPKKSSVFIGNLPLDIEEEDIWLHFAQCGKVCGVRVVRDKQTNLGKGFGYVLFESPSSVQLALSLADSTLTGRKIRVTRCLDSKTKPNLKRPRESLIIEGERAVKGVEKPPKKKSSKSSRLRSKNWKGKKPQSKK